MKMGHAGALLSHAAGRRQASLGTPVPRTPTAATDNRAGDGTEANVPDHETNDVGLERAVDDVSESSVFAIFTMLFCCQYCS